jgi:hypothetical protein
MKRLVLFVALLVGASSAYAQNLKPTWRMAVEGSTLTITVSAKTLPADASVTKATCFVEFMDSRGEVWESRELSTPGLPIPGGQERSHTTRLFAETSIVRGVRMDWVVTRPPGPVVGVRLANPSATPIVVPQGSSPADTEFVTTRKPAQMELLSCTRQSYLKTNRGPIPTSIELRNTSANRRLLYQLDPQGGRIPDGEVLPGQARTLNTFLGQLWVIAEPSGTCAGILVPRATPGWVVLK